MYSVEYTTYKKQPLRNETNEIKTANYAFIPIYDRLYSNKKSYKYYS